MTTLIRPWRSTLKPLLNHCQKPRFLNPFTSKSTSYNPFITSFSTKIGTHNGSFHCDEALGCFLLRLTPKFSGSTIVRTRDLEVLEKMDAVVDVGGVFDLSRDRYDHHQKGFYEVFGHGFETKLSSAGLVYKYYGKEIIAKELEIDQEHPDVHCLFLAVYKNFIEAVDAADNGINQYSSDLLPRYAINTYLSSRVGRLNLNWTDSDQSPEQEDEAFQKAVKLAGSEFLESIHFHARSWLPARSIVAECIAARHDVDSRGEIMVLKKPCPWKLHIFELEKKMKVEPSVKYVIYELIYALAINLDYQLISMMPKSDDDRKTSWRVQAVAVGPDRFDSWKPLPCHWRGLEGNELSEVSGIPGCVFVHMSGFIGGNKTYEGAIEMARESLKT